MIWTSAVEPHDAERNDRWRRAVGSPLIRAHASAVRGALDRLAIASWNIHVGSADVVRFVADLREGRLSNGVRVEEFVLLVQEVFRAGDDVPAPMPADAAGPPAIRETGRAGRRTDIETLARSLGLFVAYVPSMRNGAEANPVTGLCEDRGNAILATRPVESLVALELPMLHQRRVALLGVVRGRTSHGDAWSLEIGSVHLDVRAFPRGRARQAHAIVAAARAPASVVAGDLNVLPWLERAPRILRDAFPQTRQGDAEPTFAHRVRGKLDYQFCRLPSPLESTPSRRVGSLYDSDHYPMLSQIVFRRSVGASNAGP